MQRWRLLTGDRYHRLRAVQQGFHFEGLYADRACAAPHQRNMLSMRGSRSSSHLW